MKKSLGIAGSVHVSAGVCTRHMGVVDCECRCLQSSGRGSGYVAILAHREQRKAMAIWVQVFVES